MKSPEHQPTTLAMKGSFRFRLERVRALRERREDQAKQALATTMADHFRAEEELRAAGERIANARAAQLDAAMSPRAATDLLAHQAYLERAESVETVTRHNLDCRELELADRRHALGRAARDRQALERLKERRRAEHQREATRIEGLLLDEIAINNFRRRTA